MKGTGVYATEEQLENMKFAAKQAANTPAIALSSKQALDGRDFASQAHLSVKEICYRYALKNGLPEIQGFYGVVADGEFVVA